MRQASIYAALWLMLISPSTRAQSTNDANETAPENTSASVLDAKIKAADAKSNEAAARIDAADAKVETAQAKEAAALDAAQRAKNQLNDVRANKLIAYGVTAGFSLVAQTRSPGPAKDKAAQRSLNVTTMPYVALIPAYWFFNDSLSTYCASNFISTDDAAATSAAFERAKIRARAGASPELLRRLNSTSPETKQAAEDELHKLAKDKIWNPEPGYRGRCGWAKVGLYIGKPSDYDASILPSRGQQEIKRKVNPTGSIGLAIVPNAYVTVLLGMTASSYTEPAVPESGGEPGRPEEIHRFSSFTLGVGGNLDLLGALFK
ncbi:hypothetical protein [Myxococcus faecalis]|uniref:hypothetical protein n=1 Tax=Myxococcus faecalis TaxID=3115646 RepID=UPI003CF8E9E5